MNVEHTLKEYQGYVKMIAYQMIKKLPPNVEMDDLVQAGMIGLQHAAQNFDETQGWKFETFAQRRVRGAMLDELRRQDWLSRAERAEMGDQFFMESIHRNEDDENGSDFDMVSTEDTEQMFSRKQMVEALVLEIEKLPQREQRIMSLIYEHDMTCREVGAVLNLTPSRISQMHTQIVRTLSRKMARH